MESIPTRKLKIGTGTNVGHATEIEYDIGLGASNPRFSILAAALFFTLNKKLALLDDFTVAGNAVFSGNVEIQGTQTYLNTTDLLVEDKMISINYGGTTAGAAGAGFEVLGTSNAILATMKYDSTVPSKFKVGAVGAESEILTAGTAQTVTGYKIFSGALEAGTAGGTTVFPFYGNSFHLSGSGTAAAGYRISNTGGSCYLALDSSVGGNYVTGAAAYSLNLVGAAGGGIAFSGGSSTLGGQLGPDNNWRLGSNTSGPRVYGKTDGAAVAAALIGEKKSVTPGNVALADVIGTAKTVATLTLTAGTWMIYGTVTCGPCGTTTTYWDASISTVNNTHRATAINRVPGSTASARFMCQPMFHTFTGADIDVYIVMDVSGTGSIPSTTGSVMEFFAIRIG